MYAPQAKQRAPRENARLVTPAQRIAGQGARDAERCALRDYVSLWLGDDGTGSAGCSCASAMSALAQMHEGGAPTRLLSLTRNSHVALSAAVAHDTSSPDAVRLSQSYDGVVWCIDPAALRALPHALQGLGDLSTAGEVRAAVLRAADASSDEAARQAADVVRAAIRGEACRADGMCSELEALERLGATGGAPFCTFFLPQQDAAATGNATVYAAMSDPGVLFDEWLEHCAPAGSVVRVVVPHELKCEALHKLSVASVSDRTLSPTLRGLGRWICFFNVPGKDWNLVHVPQGGPAPDRAEGAPRKPAADQQQQQQPRGRDKGAAAAASEQTQNAKPIHTYRPETVEQLLDVIYGDDLAWSPRFNVFRTPYAFRGLPNAAWRQQTVLQRTSGNDAERMPTNEDRSLRFFKRYSPAYCHSVRDLNMNNVYTLMSVMSHVGAPTRMLNWSKSPFVALHYAVADLDHIDEDGLVVCALCSKLNARLPKAISDFSQASATNFFTAIELETAVRNSDAYVLSTHRQANAVNASTRDSDLRDLTSLSDSTFCVWLEPAGIPEQHVVAQSTIQSLLSRPDVCFDDWIAQYPDACRRIVIPARLKLKVCELLDQMNVSEATLSPSSEGVAAFLRRRYTSVRASTPVVQ
eukprot:m51a1_g14516 hypothetical protein (639) ;mRNA; f:850643-852792